MSKNNNCYLTYEIDSGDICHEPRNVYTNYIQNNNNCKSYKNLYYYPNYNEFYCTQKNFNYNCFNTNLSNYYKTLNNKSNISLNHQFLNSKNNKSNNSVNSNSTVNFKKDNIDFNKNADKKIILTYEYKNISPLEITQRTKELSDLESKLDKLNKPKKSKRRAKSVTGHNMKYSKRISNPNFETQNEFKFSTFGSINKSRIKNSVKIRKNKTYNNSLNYSKMGLNNSNMLNSKIWKKKYLKVNEEIENTKQKINEIKNNSEQIEKRLNFVKENENNKNLLYRKNSKLSNRNNKLIEKYKLSEEIRQKQLDLITKMQKEINNMKEKLQVLGQNN